MTVPATNAPAPTSTPAPAPAPEVKPAEAPAAAPAAKPAAEATPPAPPSEQPKSEPKPAEPAKPVAPEKYDLKLPEHTLLDATHVEKISALAKAHGLSNEKAQELLEGEHQIVADFVEKKKEEWLGQARADKEIGGDALKENVELAHRVVARFFTPEFQQELNRTGYGNHPELLRGLVRLGKAMSEDKLVMPGAQAPKQPKSAAEVLYGSTS